MGKKGVSSGIPTGMPVSEHSLGSLGYPPRRDKRVPAAIIRFWRLRCFTAFHSPSAMQRKVRRRGRECRCWSVVRTVGLIRLAAPTTHSQHHQFWRHASGAIC